MSGSAESTSTIAIGSFLDALAGKQSTPGGGGAAALTGSQAAALLSMVINFTIGNKRYANVEDEMSSYLEKSEGLRQQLLQLADEDIAAFNAVSATYGMPKGTAEEKAARTQAMQEALKGAAAVPFRVAQDCLEVIRLAAPVGEKGNKNVVSDAATALYLADAGLRSALVNVNINLKFIRDEEFVAEWSQNRDQLLSDAESAYEDAKETCEKTLGINL